MTTTLDSDALLKAVLKSRSTKSMDSKDAKLASSRSSLPVGDDDDYGNHHGGNNSVIAKADYSHERQVNRSHRYRNDERVDRKSKPEKRRSRDRKSRRYRSDSVSSDSASSDASNSDEEILDKEIFSRKRRSPSRSSRSRSEDRKSHHGRRKHRRSSRDRKRERSRSRSRDISHRRHRRSHQEDFRDERYELKGRTSRKYDHDDRYDNYHRHRRSYERERRRSPSPDRFKYHSSRHDSRRPSRSSPSQPKNLQEEVDKLDRTVGVFNLGNRVRGRDLLDFFEGEKIGKVKDARIVRDNRTGLSKGVGYVEFAESKSVDRAVELSGAKIMGKSCSIQRTDAEKQLLIQQLGDQSMSSAMESSYSSGNLSHHSGSNGTTNASSSASLNLEPSPKKLSISNLHPNLTETEVRKIFEQFGQISSKESSVVVLRDSSGVSLEEANVTFESADDARRAMQAMNGFELAGSRLEVTFDVSGADMQSNKKLVSLSNDESSYFESDEVSGDKYVSSTAPAVSRQDLMEKLSRDNSPKKSFTISDIPKSSVKTRNCLLYNMFDPKDPECSNEYLNEIKEDVHDECTRLALSKKGDTVPEKPVTDIRVDSNHDGGLIFLEFADSFSCSNVQAIMNGRWFAGRKIQAYYLEDEVFKSYCPN